MIQEPPCLRLRAVSPEPISFYFPRHYWQTSPQMRPFETHKIVTTTPLSAARPNEPRNRFYIETFYFGGILVSMNANKANISMDKPKRDHDSRI